MIAVYVHQIDEYCANKTRKNSVLLKYRTEEKLIIKIQNNLNLFSSKRQENMVTDGTTTFVFTNFQADNFGTSSGKDEENVVYK